MRTPALPGKRCVLSPKRAPPLRNREPYAGEVHRPRAPVIATLLKPRPVSKAGGTAPFRSIKSSTNPPKPTPTIREKHKIGEKDASELPLTNASNACIFLMARCYGDTLLSGREGMRALPNPC